MDDLLIELAEDITKYLSKTSTYKIRRLTYGLDVDDLFMEVLEKLQSEPDEVIAQLEENDNGNVGVYIDRIYELMEV